MSIIEKALILLESDFFRGMTSEEVARVAARTVEQHFDAGAEIEYHRGICLVLEGRVEIRLGEETIRTIGPGQGIGLGSVLGLEESRGFRTRVAEHTHVLAIPRDEFLEILTEYPELAIALLRETMRTTLLLHHRIEELQAEMRRAGVSVPGAASPSEPGRPLPAD